MKRFFRYLGIILLGFGFTFTCNAQTGAAKTFKIGVVDVEKIVKEMPEALQADQTLKTLQQSYQDTLNSMQNSLVTRADNYQKQKSMMTADKQKTEEVALQAAEQAIYKFREDKTAEMSDKRENYLAPIRKKVSTAIETVAKSEGLSIVLDKGDGGVLYSEDKYDITYKVIDEVKRGTK